MTFVQLENLSFRYPRAREKVLDRFSLTMDKGEIVALLGSSGSGKSTLLRLIAGLETPAEGSIVIGGRTVVSQGTFVAPEQRGVGMVFQDYALFPHLNVARNITFGLHRLSRKERAQRLRDMIKLVRLEGYEGRYPHELSGGQQQRVALARAIAPQPTLLLMDEPFNHLDASLKKKIHKEVRDILVKSGMTCLLVTHDREDAEAVCDRTVFIS